MSAWRVGSKTKVTLFKGDEIFGILLDPEKAAVVVSMLNLADRLSADDGPWLSALSDEELRRLVARIILERRRRGVEVPQWAAEGGAEGDLAAPCPHVVWLPEVGAWGGGGCPPFCGGGESGELREGGAVG